MNVWVLGAGASKAYADSPSGQRMPLARDFISTYQSLPIRTERWVIVGDIVNYLWLEKKKKITESPFTDDLDIEELHSEIQTKLNELIQKRRNGTFDMERDFRRLSMYWGAYNQLLFLFASVLNEIQNGPTSKAHLKLAQQISADDSVITFNWDTLLDRALFDSNKWSPDSGYIVKPCSIYDCTRWRKAKNEPLRGPSLIKLHGSTNWLTGAHILREADVETTQTASANTLFVYYHATGPYATHDGRWAKLYCPFSYGYYPPNLEDKGRAAPEGYTIFSGILRGPGFPEPGKASSAGLKSMPLIVPPVKSKQYEFFGDLFARLWSSAEENLVSAEKIIIIGYSFPRTDYKSGDLFLKAMMKRKNVPKVVIVDPAPDRIVDKMVFEFGIPKENIDCRAVCFSADFPLAEII